MSSSNFPQVDGLHTANSMTFLCSSLAVLPVFCDFHWGSICSQSGGLSNNRLMDLSRDGCNYCRMNCQLYFMTALDVPAARRILWENLAINVESSARLKQSRVHCKHMLTIGNILNFLYFKATFYAWSFQRKIHSSQQRSKQSLIFQQMNDFNECIWSWTQVTWP